MKFVSKSKNEIKTANDPWEHVLNSDMELQYKSLKSQGHNSFNFYPSSHPLQFMKIVDN